MTLWLPAAVEAVGAELGGAGVCPGIRSPFEAGCWEQA
jgi:hypothetical protein